MCANTRRLYSSYTMRRPRILPTQAILQLCNETSQDPHHVDYNPAIQIMRGPRIRDIPGSSQRRLYPSNMQRGIPESSLYRLCPSYAMRRPRILPTQAIPQACNDTSKNPPPTTAIPQLCNDVLGFSPHRLEIMGCSS